MQVKDIMTERVISVTPETGVPDVARLLLERHISAVPVIDAAGRLVGIVSEGDLLRRIEGEERRRGSWWLWLLSDASADAADYVKAHGRSAADVMTRNVVAVTEDMSLGDLAHLLESKRIKRAPVLRDGRVVGVVSRADLLRGLATRREIVPAAASPADGAIRRRILDEIEHAHWAPTYGLTVQVADGIVQIWGIADSQEQIDALRVAAENVEGVKGVELNLGTLPAYAWAE